MAMADGADAGLQPVFDGPDVWPPPLWPGHFCSHNVLQVQNAKGCSLVKPPYKLNIRFDFRHATAEPPRTLARLAILDGQLLRKLGQGVGLDVVQAARSWIARKALCARPLRLADLSRGLLHGQVEVQLQPRTPLEQGGDVLLLLAVFGSEKLGTSQQAWIAPFEPLVLRLESALAQCPLCFETVVARSLLQHQRTQCKSLVLVQDGSRSTPIPDEESPAPGHVPWPHLGPPKTGEESPAEGEVPWPLSVPGQLWSLSEDGEEEHEPEREKEKENEREKENAGETAREKEKDKDKDKEREREKEKEKEKERAMENEKEQEDEQEKEQEEKTEKEKEKEKEKTREKETENEWIAGEQLEVKALSTKGSQTEDQAEGPSIPWTRVLASLQKGIWEGMMAHFKENRRLPLPRRNRGTQTEQQVGKDHSDFGCQAGQEQEEDVTADALHRVSWSWVLLLLLLMVLGNVLALVGILIAGLDTAELWALLSVLLLQVVMNAIELGVFEVSLKRHERQDLSSWRQQHVRLNRLVLTVTLLITPEALRFYEAIIAAALLQREGGSALSPPQVGMKRPSYFPAASQQPAQLLKILPSDQPSSAAQKIQPAADRPFSADKIRPGSLVRKVLPAGAEPFVADRESGFSPPVLRSDAVHGALPAGCGQLLPNAPGSSHLGEKESSSSCPLCSHEEPIPSRQQLLRSSRVAAYGNLPQLLVALWLAYHAEAERTAGWEKALPVHCLTAAVHSLVLCALALRWARYLLRRWAKQPPEELVASMKDSALEVEWPKAAGAFHHARVVSCFSEDRRLIEIFQGGSRGVLALRHLEPGDYLVCAQAQRRFGGLSMPLAVGRVRVLGCPTQAEVPSQPQADLHREASCQVELRVVAESGSQTEPLLGSPSGPDGAAVPATPEAEAAAKQVVAGPRVSAETQTEDSAPQQVVVPGLKVSAESQTDALVHQEPVVLGPRFAAESQSEVAALQQVAVPGLRVSTEDAAPQQVVVPRTTASAESQTEDAAPYPVVVPGPCVSTEETVGPQQALVPRPRVSAETQTEAVGGQVAERVKRLRLLATTGTQTQAEQLSMASQTDPISPEEELRACRHRKNGCGWGGRDEEGHAITCPYRRVSCQNREQGCTWAGSFRDMPSHFCEAITVSCPNATWGCRWRGYQRELQRHAEAKCRVRAPCRHHARGCAWRGTDAEERLHGFSCPFSDTELRVLCPNAPRGCPWRGPETQLGAHLDHCKRRPPKQPEGSVSPRPLGDDRPCRNQSWGCLWRGAASEELGHAQECCWHSCRWGCDWRGSLSEEPEHAAACSFTAAQEPKHASLAPVNGTPVLDEKVLEKLKERGACPAGYAWFQILAEDPAHCHPEANCDLCAARFRTGFQCAGGGHFICHDCLSRPSTLPLTEGPQDPGVKDERVLEVLQQLTGSKASGAWFQTSADGQAAELPAPCHLCSARSGAGFHCVTAICSSCVQDALQAK